VVRLEDGSPPSKDEKGRGEERRHPTRTWEVADEESHRNTHFAHWKRWMARLPEKGNADVGWDRWRQKTSDGKTGVQPLGKKKKKTQLEKNAKKGEQRAS